MKRVEPVLPFRALTTLALVVLLGHLALFQAVSLTLSPPLNLTGHAFSTRSIELGRDRAASPQAGGAARIPARTRRRPAPPDATGAEGPSTRMAQIDAIEPPPAPGTHEKRSGDPDAVEKQEQPADSADELALAPRPLREQIGSARHFIVPGSVTLKYQVASNRFPFGLNAELAWRQDGASYDARLVFGALGLSRVQTSRGQISGEGLAPLRFSDKYRSEVASHFVRDKGKVTFSANTPDVALLAGAQDRLSIVVQLAAMMAGDTARFPTATTIALQIVGPRDADIWLFTVEDEEVLALPGGQQSTRKLVRNPRQEFDQKVELWLAPELGYLPARIRITEANGDFVDQKWLASEPPT